VIESFYLGIAIACRWSSVRPSVSNVGESASHRLEMETNCMDN